MPVYKRRHRDRFSDARQERDEHIRRRFLRPVNPYAHFGMNPYTGEEINIPLSLLGEGLAVVGPPGSGKTHRLITLIHAFARAGHSVVVLDPKGKSLELLNTCIQAGHTYGLPVRWFSTVDSLPTFGMNVVQTERWALRTIQPQLDYIAASVNLLFGAEFGQSWFSDSAQEVIRYALRENPVSNLRDLYEHIHYLVTAPTKSTGLPQEFKRSGLHPAAIFSRLSSAIALNVTTLWPAGISPLVARHQIDVAELYEQPQILHFHAPSLGAMGGEICRFVLQDIVDAAPLNYSGPRVFVLADEIATIQASSLSKLLWLCRSSNIGMCLFTQSLTELKSSRLDDTIANCTRMIEIFGVSSEEAHHLAQVWPQTVDFTRSVNYLPSEGIGLFRTAPQIKSVTVSETLAPLIDQTLMAQVTDHPMQSMIYVKRGAGAAQFGGRPCINQFQYFTSQANYDRLKSTPFPEGVPGTFIPRNVDPGSSSDHVQIA